MMKTKLFAAISFSLLSVGCLAQQESAPNVKVVNDPLLWKHALKLRPAQENRILLLNEAFYNAILSETNTSNTRPKSKSDLERLVEERSERIWNTFSTKQKKTWKKLSATYNGDSEAVSL